MQPLEPLSAWNPLRFIPLYSSNLLPNSYKENTSLKVARLALTTLAIMGATLFLSVNFPLCFAPILTVSIISLHYILSKEDALTEQAKIIKAVHEYITKDRPSIAAHQVLSRDPKGIQELIKLGHKQCLTKESAALPPSLPSDQLTVASRLDTLAFPQQATPIAQPRQNGGLFLIHTYNTDVFAALVHSGAYSFEEDSYLYKELLFFLKYPNESDIKKLQAILETYATTLKSEQSPEWIVEHILKKIKDKDQAQLFKDQGFTSVGGDHKNLMNQTLESHLKELSALSEKVKRGQALSEEEQSVRYTLTHKIAILMQISATPTTLFGENFNTLDESALPRLLQLAEAAS